ncbi:MAG TPA: YSC84-related protein, partial [Bordetella sp.]
MAKAIVILASFALAGCTTISANNTASATQQRNEINAQANATLTKLYQAAPQTKSLVGQSKGILIFPSIVGASFIVGAEHGKGVLRQNDQPVAYYSTTSGSVGLQAGAQSRATVLLFMTDEALLNFKKSEGWTAGADAKVAVAN